ncbi:MAG TPA: hypothetical protein VEC75_00235 [Stellaceae bacterium]|nr:hypothetical protein [Stellaceae bacterium]
MHTRSRVMSGALASAGAIAVLSLSGPLTTRPAYADCMSGERIDASTANDALRRFTAAGYPSVHALRKGCDNYWHGVAERNGAEVNVVLAPSGNVMQEGD